MTPSDHNIQIINPDDKLHHSDRLEDLQSHDLYLKWDAECEMSVRGTEKQIELEGAQTLTHSAAHKGCLRTKHSLNSYFTRRLCWKHD